MLAPLLVAVFAAQAPAIAPAFEVASVKPSASRERAMRIIWPRGRFSAANVTIRQFIQAAYVLEPFRVEGGPGWLSGDRFNIEATVGADTVVAQGGGMPEAIRLMMQKLLPDPFGFAAHWQRRPARSTSTCHGRPIPRPTPGRRSSPQCRSSLA